MRARAKSQRIRLGTDRRTLYVLWLWLYARNRNGDNRRGSHREQGAFLFLVFWDQATLLSLLYLE